MKFCSKLSNSCEWICVYQSAQLLVFNIGRPTIALVAFKDLVTGAGAEFSEPPLCGTFNSDIWVIHVIDMGSSPRCF